MIEYARAVVLDHDTYESFQRDVIERARDLGKRRVNYRVRFLIGRWAAHTVWAEPAPDDAALDAAQSEFLATMRRVPPQREQSEGSE